MDLSGVPKILTPTDGVALCYKPPDPARYPFRFGTHVYPDELPGCELRGTDGYQLVPSSVLTNGAYRFSDGVIPTRLYDQCPELPPELRNLWITLDRTRRVSDADASGEGEEENDPTTQTKKLVDGRAPEVLETVPTIKSFTSLEILKLFGNFHANLAVAKVLGIPPLGEDFLCWRHPEETPSMSVYQDRRTGAWKVHDWHLDNSGDPREHMGLADLYAWRISGQDRRLRGKPTLTVWWLRALIASGFLEPADVPEKPLPPGVRPSVATLYDGFILNLQCKWLTKPGTPTPYTREFAKAWCGLKSNHIVEDGIYWLRRHGYMRYVGHQNGSQVFLPGEGL
jgi:hypothetical protein